MSRPAKLEPVDQPEATPAEPQAPAIVQALVALVNATIADGHHELNRAVGKRGLLELSVEIVTGDTGFPVFADTRLAFTQKRHIKDANN